MWPISVLFLTANFVKCDKIHCISDFLSSSIMPTNLVLTRFKCLSKNRIRVYLFVIYYLYIYVCVIYLLVSKKDG